MEQEIQVLSMGQKIDVKAFEDHNAGKAIKILLQP